MVFSQKGSQMFITWTKTGTVRNSKTKYKTKQNKTVKYRQLLLCLNLIPDYTV